jgi:hypothetical protein
MRLVLLSSFRLFLVIVIAILSASCSSLKGDITSQELDLQPNSELTIKELKICPSSEDKPCLKNTSKLSPQTETIQLSGFLLNPLPTQNSVKVAWQYIDFQLASDSSFMIAEEQITVVKDQQNLIISKQPKPQADWPKGIYQLIISTTDDQVLATKDFTID